MRSPIFILTTVLCVHQASSVRAVAQTPAEPSSYDPRVTFAPLTLPDPVNVYRSSNGAPGPNYWQNQADYDLHAELDTEGKRLKATETITYTNNSPDLLHGWIPRPTRETGAARHGRGEIQGWNQRPLESAGGDLAFEKLDCLERRGRKADRFGRDRPGPRAAG